MIPEDILSMLASHTLLSINRTFLDHPLNMPPGKQRVATKSLPRMQSQRKTNRAVEMMMKELTRMIRKQPRLTQVELVAKTRKKASILRAIQCVPSKRVSSKRKQRNNSWTRIRETMKMPFRR